MQIRLGWVALGWFFFMETECPRQNVHARMVLCGKSGILSVMSRVMRRPRLVTEGGSKLALFMTAAAVGVTQENFGSCLARPCFSIDGGQVVVVDHLKTPFRDRNGFSSRNED